MHDRTDDRLCVLQVVPNASSAGGRRGVTGWERTAFEMLSRWDYGRIRIVATYDSDGTLWGDFADVAARNPALRLVDYPAPRRKSWDSLGYLRRLMRWEGVDVAHTFGPHGADWWTATAGRLCGVRTVVSRPYTMRDYQMGRKTEMRFRATDRLALTGTAVLVFDSEAVRSRAIAQRDCRRRDTALIYNGVDLRRFAPEGNDPGLPDTGSRPTFGMVAQMTPVKSWDCFIEAAGLIAEAVPDALGLIVGDGPERNRLEALVRERGLSDRLRFTGFSSDVSRVLRQFDVFVLTSLREGLPFAIAEAMGMAKPVVATDVGGVREMVVEGRTGFLVPSRDPRAVARRVVELLRNPQQRRNFGRAARERAESTFSLDAMVHAYQDLYYRHARRSADPAQMMGAPRPAAAPAADRVHVSS